MRNFQDKKSGNSLLYSWPVLVVFAVLILFFAWGVIRFMIKMNDTEKNRRIAEIKVEELSKSKVKLSSDIASLMTEKGIEENIRERFGFAKEGEELIVVVEDRSALKQEVAPEEGWFKVMIKRWFK